MDDMHNIIGMTRLLDEIDRDLDDFRRKHPSDYSAKNVTLWWELEKERLLVRYGPKSAVKKPRMSWLASHSVLLFLSGALTWTVGQVILLLLRK